ncbi:TPA: CapA family protein [Streptococcus suis]
MDRRRSRRGKHMRKQKKIGIAGPIILVAGLALGVFLLKDYFPWQKNQQTQESQATHQSTETEASQSVETVKTARIMAHGDLLYHDIIYASALQADGSYDFSENFTYVQPWLEQADLAIGDFEGTISDDFPLAGYPLFNAPSSVATAMGQAGYDVMDLAHNHILDSHLSGLQSTVNYLAAAGIDSVGVYPDGNRAEMPIYIREVNGIKIAILAYAYGFNGMEAGLTQEEYDAYLSDLNQEKMQAELARAEREADFTIVMPQMGVEYQIEPSQEQIDLYHQMVEWGADVVLGGHPHVIQPSETLEKDGEKKLIIYSMGNFLSNQRMETMEGVLNYQWTERGVLMDLEIEKDHSGTRIKTAQARPSWVKRVPREGTPYYLYQTLILEDFIAGGTYRDQLSPEDQARIDQAYQETLDHVGLNW